MVAQDALYSYYSVQQTFMIHYLGLVHANIWIIESIVKTHQKMTLETLSRQELGPTINISLTRIENLTVDILTVNTMSEWSPRQDWISYVFLAKLTFPSICFLRNHISVMTVLTSFMAALTDSGANSQNKYFSTLQISCLHTTSLNWILPWFQTVMTLAAWELTIVHLSAPVLAQS